MFGPNKLKLMFFNEAKHGQEGNITQYLFLPDLINLSKISPEANRLSKIQVQQTCFSRFIQFMSHPDIVDKPIIDKEESIVIARYPNEKEILDLKKGNDILNVLDRVSSPLYLDLKNSLKNDTKVNPAFELLLIPEIFLLPELHQSIRDKLKTICYRYSAGILKIIISAIQSNATLDSNGNLSPVFVESVEKYEALAYKIGYLEINYYLNIGVRLNTRYSISNITINPYYAKKHNDKVLQFLFDHKILYFGESRNSHDHGCFDSPIMEAARYASVKLFELTSHSLPPHNNYHYNFLMHGGVNELPDDGCLRSPLMVAARCNRIDIVKHILENEKTAAADLIQSDDKGWTALMHASCEGHIEVVKLIIHKASSLGLVSELVNFCGSSKQTALTIAAYTGKLEVVQQLFPYIEQLVKVESNNDQNQQCINQFEVALQLAKNKMYDKIETFLRSYLPKPTSGQCRLM